jgi:hypothetical protein
MPQRRPAPGPADLCEQAGKQSHPIERRLSCLTTKPLPKRLKHVGCLVHDQDADTQDTASAVVRRARGRRIVNSVNSPTRLSTSIVPPCCWLTMS